MTWAIRRIGDDEVDLAALVGLVNEVTPDNSTSVEEIRWADATYPGTVRYLAGDAKRAVGAGTVGRIWMFPPDFDGLWGSVDVRPEAQRRGLGSALLHAIADEARAAGKTALHIETRADRPDSVAFLEHRGFVERKRMRLVALDLRGRTPPAIDAPPGVTITTLRERPDLFEGVFAVATESFPDIPSGGGTPIAVGDLAEFRARDVDRPGIPADAFMVAVDDADGRVVGYASLIGQPGSKTRAYHDMTAVVRAWRGRGLAGALKRATIAWAIGAGLAWLETGNDVSNAPMRAVNARLGYEPLPDLLEFRGLVADIPAPPAAR